MPVQPPFNLIPHLTQPVASPWQAVAEGMSKIGQAFFEGYEAKKQRERDAINDITKNYKLTTMTPDEINAGTVSVGDILSAKLGGKLPSYLPGEFAALKATPLADLKAMADMYGSSLRALPAGETTTAGEVAPNVGQVGINPQTPVQGKPLPKPNAQSGEDETKRNARWGKSARDIVVKALAEARQQSKLGQSERDRSLGTINMPQDEITTRNEITANARRNAVAMAKAEGIPQNMVDTAFNTYEASNKKQDESFQKNLQAAMTAVSGVKDPAARAKTKKRVMALLLERFRPYREKINASFKDIK